MPAGYTCESPTPDLSVPLLQTTMVANTPSMSDALQTRIAQALAQITTLNASVYSNSMDERSDFDASGFMKAGLKKRQLASPASPGSFTITNFISHNFNPIAHATSDISFDMSVLGLTTHCSASRALGQGSAATGGSHPCDFSDASFEWTDPLSIRTSLTLPGINGYVFEFL